MNKNRHIYSIDGNNDMDNLAGNKDLRKSDGMKKNISALILGLACLTLSFKGLDSDTGTVRDIDGNVYKTIKIGNQWWMAENLRVTKNPRGKPIKGYFYKDDASTYGKYGLLYTWETAMDGSSMENTQGIAPEGWHIPSERDWKELINTLGGEEKVAEKIKVGGSTGFNAYLSGGADFKGEYLYFKKYAMFWSSTSVNEERAIHVGFSDENKWESFAAKKNGRIHIRCIKDK